MLSDIILFTTVNDICISIKFTILVSNCCLNMVFHMVNYVKNLQIYIYGLTRPLNPALINIIQIYCINWTCFFIVSNGCKRFWSIMFIYIFTRLLFFFYNKIVFFNFFFSLILNKNNFNYV